MAELNPLCRNASYAMKEIQMMLKDERLVNNCVTCVIAGRWVQAKVFNVGSEYGINGGRVSQLSISKTAMRDHRKNFAEQMDYNYDRGNVDEFWSNLPEKDVLVVVAALEKLEPVYQNDEQRKAAGVL